MAKNDATLREKRSNVVARTIDQRPDYDAATWMHTCQTPSACPTDETQEKGFRLVLLRVTNGDPIRLMGGDRALEEGVSNAVSRIFQRTMFPTCDGANVRAFDCEREPEIGGDLCAQPFVSIGFVAKLMIQMRDRDESQFAGVVQRSQYMEQRGGVGPARDGRRHTCGRRRQVVLCECPPNPVDQGHAVDPVGFSGFQFRGASSLALRSLFVVRPHARTKHQDPGTKDRARQECEKRADARMVPEGGLEPPTPRL